MDRFETLAAFVTVADCGAFVGAARRLGRSPTAVTRAVAALERRLGVRLFNRTTRAVALTDAGRRHVERARRVLGEMAAMEASVAAEGQGPMGPLTVAASVVFGRLHVQPLVTDFLRRHPAVDVRLELSDRVASLVEEGIDLEERAHRRDERAQVDHVRLADGTVKTAGPASSTTSTAFLNLGAKYVAQAGEAAAAARSFSAASDPGVPKGAPRGSGSETRTYL